MLVAHPNTYNTKTQHHQQQYVPPPTSPPVEVPLGLFCYLLNKKYLLIGGALTDGGNIIEWYKNTITSQLPVLTPITPRHKPPIEKRTVAGTATSLVDGANDDRDHHNYNNIPIVLPFFTPGSGERSTGYHTNATGIIAKKRE